MTLEILAGLVVALGVYLEVRARLSHQSFLTELKTTEGNIKDAITAEVAKVLHPSTAAPAASVSHTVTVTTGGTPATTTTTSTPPNFAQAAANQAKITAALAAPLDTSKVDVAELGRLLSTNGESDFDLATGMITAHPGKPTLDAVQVIEQKIVQGTAITPAELAFASQRLSDFQTRTNADGMISATYAPLAKP